jgi:hypothetical protein
MIGNPVDAFVIRNGKIHIEPNRKIRDPKAIEAIRHEILNSLKSDLGMLRTKNILLDPRVHYGLPISRKQVVGQLPFGTRVKMQERLSAGIYWHNSGGARDLDLSTIDTNGYRTGWGQYSGYDQSNAVTFSGDVTSAPNGAMEFITSQGKDYGLFVNIFCGQVGCDMEIVVGPDSKGKKRWIEKPVIREKTKLGSRGMIVGFVKDTDYIVYQGRLGSSRVSGGSKAIIDRGMADFWTVNDLFDALDIKYDVYKDEDKVYNVNLSYEGFSYDRLESVLL